MQRLQGYVEAGGKTVSIPGTDGSSTDFQQSYPGATVTVTISGHATASISTISRVSNTVTLTATAAHGFVPGGSLVVTGVADAGFDGSFTVASIPTPTTVTYAQTAANASSTGGTANFFPSLYADNAGTPKANPFTADSLDATWFFYSLAGRYDVKFSGGGIAVPFTVGDLALEDDISAQTVTFSVTPTFDAATAKLFAITLTGNVTSSTLTNLSAGEVIAFSIAQDAVGGHTFAWPTNVTGGPTVNPSASATTYVSGISDGTTLFITSARDSNGNVLTQADLVSSGNALSLPSVADTLVGRATTDTLSNKSLVSPSMTSPTISSGPLALPGGAQLSGASGAATLAAGGTNENVNLAPSGSGSTVLSSGSLTLPGGAQLSGASGSATLAAAGSNQGITLTPSGSGTISLSSPVSGLEDKGGQLYNVKAFGAKGDGTTDDTTAIQAAIAALPTDGVVFFPPGTYGISGTLTLGTSQHMAGPAVIKWIGSAPGSLTDMLTVGNSLASSERQSVDQLTFDGANTANLVGLHVLNCHDGRFSRLTFQNFNVGSDTALILEGNLSGVNCAENHFDHITMPVSGSAGTVVHGITLTGTSTSFVTVNTFVATTIFLSTAASAIGIRCIQYCDSNTFVSTYINNQSANGVGVTFNEGATPTTVDYDVDNIHFIHLAMDSVAGGTGLLFNKSAAIVVDGFEYSTAGTAFLDNVPSFNTYLILTTAGTIGTVNHGFPVNKLNSQLNTSAITGNGSAQVFYTYSLPAGAIVQGAGIRIRAGWQHSSGTASVAYVLSLNGVSLVSLSDATSGQYLIDLTVLNSAATTGTECGTLGRAGNLLVAAQSVTGLSWAAAQTLSISFNVANTDQITPEFWLVELVQ